MAKVVWFLGPERSVNNWRSTWPAAALRGAGHDAHALCADGEHDADLRPGAVVIVHASNQYDAFIQGHRSLPGFLSTIRDRVRPSLLVVQWDDSYFDLTDLQPTGENYERWLETDVIGSARLADRVIVSTPYLRDRFAERGIEDVRVVANYIASWVCDKRLPMFLGDEVTWMGSVTLSHRRDWEWLTRTKLPPLRVVGLHGEDERWFRDHDVTLSSSRPGTSDVRELYGWVAERTRLGIAPLDPSLGFNKARSWIKPLEYAALGISSVCSDVPAYRWLQRVIPLHIAETPDGFARLVAEFHVGRPERDQGLRDHVRTTLTVEANVSSWESALDLV